MRGTETTPSVSQENDEGMEPISQFHIACPIMEKQNPTDQSDASYTETSLGTANLIIRFSAMRQAT